MNKCLNQNMLLLWERVQLQGGEQAIRQGDSEIAEAWFDQAAEYWKSPLMALYRKGKMKSIKLLRYYDGAEDGFQTWVALYKYLLHEKES
jgi:hypothetical protein